MRRAKRLGWALCVAFALVQGCAEDEARRVADDDTRDDAGVDTGESPCGEHGVFHRDHCHCDSGYTEEQGVCVAIPGCTLDDDHEPNNRLADATTATLVEGDGLVWPAAICPGDVDYYSVQVDEPGGVLLRLDSGEGRLNVSLYRPGDDPRFAGSFVDIAPREASFERVVELSVTGSWLVAARGRDSASQFEYTLRVSAVDSETEVGELDE